MAQKLHKYAKKGKKRKLKKALRRCSDIDEIDEDGKTALYYALKAGHQKCINTLLKHGANPSRALETSTNATNDAISCNLDFSKSGKSNSTISENYIIPNIPASELAVLEDSAPQITCGGWMIYRDALWADSPVTIKHANFFHSKFNKNIQMEQKRLLENEADILRDIRHSNVIKLMATCLTDDEALTLLLEPVSKRSLAFNIHKLKEGLSTKNICNALYQIILALKYIHGQSIVHNYINASSVYHLGNKIVLGDFQYAQRLANGRQQKPISSIASQLPWMAPSQADGAMPDPSSDIYSFGALTWELLARRAPCHWTHSSDLEHDSIFIFPSEGNWNLALKNIISFCVLPFADTRPDHEVLIELLEKEITQFRKDEASGRPITGKNSSSADIHTQLADLCDEDFGRLKLSLYSCNLTISKAQKMLNIASKCGRKCWAKQILVLKELEKIALDKQLPAERKDVARRIIRECRYPMREYQTDRLGVGCISGDTIKPTNKDQVSGKENSAQKEMIVLPSSSPRKSLSTTKRTVPQQFAKSELSYF